MTSEVLDDGGVDMMAVCALIWPVLLLSFAGTVEETAVVDHRGNRRYATSYEELAELAGRFAGGAGERGIAAGERVVL